MASERLKDYYRVKKTSQTPTRKNDGAGAVQTKAEDAQHVLRQFDLNWEYGPCSGITRIERWERAAKFGKNPPVEVRDILLSHADDPEFTNNCWNGFQI